jgi:hypothetical protein
MFVALAACDDEGPEMTTFDVAFQDLSALDAATEGTYEGWVIDASGAPFSTGKFDLAASGVHTFTSPIADPMMFVLTVEPPEPTMFVLTVEPPGDSDAVPSDQKLLGGAFSGGVAALSALGFVTASSSADLATSPGTHVLLTPTTMTGSDDDGGIWLLDPSGAPDPSVTLPPLATGWVYEGWVVNRPGTAMQTAISYGKYAPQADGTVSTRDSDAAGPLSGAPGDLGAGPPFPGGDFVMANGNTVPGGIALPFDFNGDDLVTGDSEWMHVISIEPTFDEGEATLAAVPFQLKPFGNPFGDTATITN